MFEFLREIEYLKKRNAEEWYYFGKVDVPLPTWDQIFSELDRIYKFCLDNKLNFIEMNKHFSMGVHGFTEVNFFRDFLNALENSHDIRGNQNFTSQCFLNLTTVESTYGKHRDEMDVWIWQVLGSSRWYIEGRKSHFDQIVHPGELIYIPRGLYHNIESITPRVSISFASENLDI